MIDKWFKKDLENIFGKGHEIAVFIDESRESKFLADSIDQKIQIYSVSDELEELKIKYEIEKNHDVNQNILIYTNIPRKELKYCREYCETNGAVEIKYLDHYVKKKVSQHLNLNINLPKEELISAAKVSVGKDQTYWFDLSHKGATEIFDLEKELLPFLDNPKTFIKKFDKNTQETFFKNLSKEAGFTYVEKPATTWASEIANHILDGLLNNTITPLFYDVYRSWLDSVSYKDSFYQYLRKYKLQAIDNPFNVHPSHPFEEVDRSWLLLVGQKIDEPTFIQSIIPKINQRNKDIGARSLGIHYWDEVKILLEFDHKNINQISSQQEAIDFYTKYCYNLDRAIRKLYALFLNDKEILEPFQNYYKNLTTVFLDKWFKYITEYESTQTGIIKTILDNHLEKTAIIVGDGLSWEFAKDIVNASGKSEYKLTENYILAGLPSETEHNMSQLYVSTGEVLATKKEREKFLVAQNPEKDISFIDLEQLNQSTNEHNYLICSHKDPDKLGETYQQNALKYFDDVARMYAEKIKQLLQIGYINVFLVTDHGYTLTGILENSDKIEVSFNGDSDKHERFIRTKTKQTINEDLLIEKNIPYKEYQYCYFAKRLGPFKTPGVYGFSHGGMTPQETIIPYFKWTNTEPSIDLLEVSISNKQDLKKVTGDIYSLKLTGKGKLSELFTVNRRIMLLFFSEGNKINESDILTIENGQDIKKEYQFGKHGKIDVIVVDAISKEQLDKVTVTQDSSRDLGGLL